LNIHQTEKIDYVSVFVSSILIKNVILQH
jgi:hypothetical protein